MIAALNGATAAGGTTGGLSATGCSSGTTVLKKKTIATKPGGKKPKRAALLGTASYAYENLLTSSDRAEWKSYGSSVTKNNKVCCPRPMTASAVFTRQYVPAALAGVSWFYHPTYYSGFPTFADPTAAELSGNTLTLEIPTGQAWQSRPNSFLLAKLTIQKNLSITTPRTGYQSLGCIYGPGSILTPTALQQLPADGSGSYTFTTPHTYTAPGQAFLELTLADGQGRYSQPVTYSLLL